MQEDLTHRFDYKYWDLETREQISLLLTKSIGLKIIDLNLITTRRGKSPTSDSYVDEEDGYALVIKAGSSISKLGKIVKENSDWIEKPVYDEFLEKEKDNKININIVKKGDVLLSSTGDGTLGKCCVYDLKTPAIADAHVTVIRVDKKMIDPFYLADYLRKGFGAVQIIRSYTGSTGLIELTPEQINNIVVDPKTDLAEQKRLSKAVRNLESKYTKKIDEASRLLDESLNIL